MLPNNNTNLELNNLHHYLKFNYIKQMSYLKLYFKAIYSIKYKL